MQTLIECIDLFWLLSWFIRQTDSHPKYYLNFIPIITTDTFRYNIEQEQKLALETTVLVEQYTVSIYKLYMYFIYISLPKFWILPDYIFKVLSFIVANINFV